MTARPAQEYQLRPVLSDVGSAHWQTYHHNVPVTLENLPDYHTIPTGYAVLSAVLVIPEFL